MSEDDALLAEFTVGPDGHLRGVLFCEFCGALVVKALNERHAEWHVDSDRRELRIKR